MRFWLLKRVASWLGLNLASVLRSEQRGLMVVVFVSPAWPYEFTGFDLRERDTAEDDQPQARVH